MAIGKERYEAEVRDDGVSSGSGLLVLDIRMMR